MLRQPQRRHWGMWTTGPNIELRYRHGRRVWSAVKCCEYPRALTHRGHHKQRFASTATWHSCEECVRTWLLLFAKRIAGALWTLLPPIPNGTTPAIYCGGVASTHGAGGSVVGVFMAETAAGHMLVWLPNSMIAPLPYLAPTCGCSPKHSEPSPSDCRSDQTSTPQHPLP